MNEKRNKEIKIRLTEREHQELLQRSKKIQLAAWMREYCLDAKVPRHRKIPPVEPRLLRQISGISNNLNQIARVVNTQAKLSSSVDKVQLIAQLATIERLLEQLLEEHTHDS